MDPRQTPPGPGGQQGSVRITMDDVPEVQNQKSTKGVRYNNKFTTTMVRDKLRSLDTNQDGTLDEAELIRGIEELVQETRMRKMFMFLALGLFLVVLVLIGAIGGMTYGIIEATKDTKISGTVLVTSDGKSAVVQTANFDMTVQDGVLVSRGANGTSNSTAAVLRAASYTTQQSFSSAVDIKALMEMKYFYVKSTEAELALAVLGVGRVPKPGSVYGTVVKILTLAGTIVLDGTMISFTEDMAPIFSEAGFVVDVRNRRLLGVYEIFGFFEYIKDKEVFNLPPNEPKPALPAGDFQMVIKVWEPCVLDYDGVPENRCHYTPGHATANYTAAPNATATNGTAARGRHLLGGANYVVIPGVETLDDGKDYMASMETITRVGNYVKTVYEYASYPGMQKIELLDETTKNISQWQVYKPKEYYAVDTNPYWCNTFKLPNNFFDKFAPKNTSGVTFTFVGYATTMGTPSRHFKLVVPQPPNADGSANPPMTVDYYDNADTHYPLFFDFYHYLGGHMMIHVESFAMLNSTTRPSVDFMKAPGADVCDNKKNWKAKSDDVPRMGSAFTMPPEQVNATGPHGNTTTTTGRRALLAFDPETGLPRHTGPAGGPGYLYDPDYHPDRPWQSAMYNQSLARRNNLEACSYEQTQLQLEFGACEFGYYMVLPAPGGVKFTFGCKGGFPGIPFFLLEGSALANICNGDIGGCLAVKLSLTAGIPFGNSKPVTFLKEKLGIEDISVLEVCGGYNYKEKQGWVKGTYAGPPLYAWIVKAEIAATVKFDSSVTYLDSVGMEVFAGIDFGFWSSYTSLGSVTFAKSVYFRGTPELEQANANPTIINYVGDITPTEGHWGDWTASSYCYASTLETGKARGLAVKGIQVRMESDSASDDTALNAIRLLCADDTTIAPHEGHWGDWTGWSKCPDGQVVTGAVMRLESTGGDDTSANSLQLMCSGNGQTKLEPHNGYWGDWTQWKWCPSGSFVCGIKVRMEVQQGSGDDTALNGATLHCCKADVDDGTKYPPPANTGK